MASENYDMLNNVDIHDAIHDEYLEQTLQEVQEQVKEHEAALSKLRSKPGVNRQIKNAPATASLEIMKAAYDDLASQAPFLPFPGSVLPALLALRRTHQTVEETKAYLTSHRKSAEDAKTQLEMARANLADQEALSRSLQDRIQTLRDNLENRMEMGTEDIARERMDELKQKKKSYNQDTSKLFKALRKFIHEHLAGMLAAEELGGPVVGDMMEIDGDDLAVGFSSQGRLKKSSKKPDDDKRQRRIDEIWGNLDETESSAEKRNEAKAAGEEMRALTEDLLNNLTQSDGDGATAYIQLPKETAAARFLVRSKVAQFHPRDSTKLRLVDFGRELDD